MDPVYWHSDSTSTPVADVTPWATSASAACATHAIGGVQCPAAGGEACCLASCGCEGNGTPEIEAVPTVFGLDEDPECFVLSNGADYRGRVDYANNGQTCLAWDSLGKIRFTEGLGSSDVAAGGLDGAELIAAYPLAGLGSHNYCRLPYGSKGPLVPEEDLSGAAAWSSLPTSWKQAFAPWCVTADGPRTCAGCLNSCEDGGDSDCLDYSYEYSYAGGENRYSCEPGTECGDASSPSGCPCAALLIFELCTPPCAVYVFNNVHMSPCDALRYATVHQC